MNKHKVKHHRNSDTKAANRDYIRTTQARRHVFKSGPAVFRASVEGTSGGGEHERGCRPSRKVGSGDLPRENFVYMVASICIFNLFWASRVNDYGDRH